MAVARARFLFSSILFLKLLHYRRARGLGNYWTIDDLGEWLLSPPSAVLMSSQIQRMQEQLQQFATRVALADLSDPAIQPGAGFRPGVWPVHPDEAARIQVLHDFHLLDTDFEVAFDRIASLGARHFEVPICLVSLVDSDRQWFKAASGLDARQTCRDAAFCTHAIMPGAPDIFEVPDATTDPRWAPAIRCRGDARGLSLPALGVAHLAAGASSGSWRRLPQPSPRPDCTPPYLPLKLPGTLGCVPTLAARLAGLTTIRWSWARPSFDTTPAEHSSVKAKRSAPFASSIALRAPLSTLRSVTSS
jgi:hypothetical protein